MELRPIKTESDYQNALTEIERLFDAKPNSPELDRLDILTTLVEAYEQQHYPIDAPRCDLGNLVLFVSPWIIRARFGDSSRSIN